VLARDVEQDDLALQRLELLLGGRADAAVRVVLEQHDRVLV
jgi:hypothetical protein